jgi:hypothetical protein
MVTATFTVNPAQCTDQAPTLWRVRFPRSRAKAVTEAADVVRRSEPICAEVEQWQHKRWRIINAKQDIRHTPASAGGDGVAIAPTWRRFGRSWRK